MKILKTVALLAFLILITWLFTFASCETETPMPTNFDAAKPYTLSNVKYGADPKQSMDIYLPANRKAATTKVLIMLHGGGWIFGDKTEFNAGVAGLMAAIPDMAIVNANYRLYSNGQNAFPAQEQDMNAIWNFVLNMRSQAQLSDKIALFGQSAGAQMVMLHAYKNHSAVQPRAVVEWYGPTDLAKLYNENTAQASVFAPVIGGTPATVPQNYFSASPVNFVSSTSAPTLILQGGGR